MRIALFALAALAAAPAQEKEAGWVSLFNGKDMTGWTCFLKDNADGKVKMEDVWSVDADKGVLTCKGVPTGYLRTVEDYTHYALKLEWRYPEKAGNSGVLLRMVGEDKVWPRSIEAQLFSEHAGDFLVIDGATLEVPQERMDPKRVRLRPAIKYNEKPVGEWNEMELVVDGGKVAAKVNGVEVNAGTGAEEVAGKICLQSEGAVIQFRNIKLKPIKK